MWSDAILHSGRKHVVEGIHWWHEEGNPKLSLSTINPTISWPVCSRSALSWANQSYVATNFIYFRNKPFPYCTDNRTKCSEDGLRCSRRLKNQNDICNRIQLNWHSISETMAANQKYNNPEFKAFCASTEMKQIFNAANYQEGNWTVERADCALHSH